MKAFPVMIAAAAAEAGIKLPPDLEDYDKARYPHWFVFCHMQLGSPMPYPDVDWDNAKVVVAFNDSEILKVTPGQLDAKGFRTGFSG